MRFTRRYALHYQLKCIVLKHAQRRQGAWVVRFNPGERADGAEGAYCASVMCCISAYLCGHLGDDVLDVLVCLRAAARHHGRTCGNTTEHHNLALKDHGKTKHLRKQGLFDACYGELRRVAGCSANWA